MAHDIPAPLLTPVQSPELPARGASQAQIAVALIALDTALESANARIAAICEIVLGEDACKRLAAG